MTHQKCENCDADNASLSRYGMHICKLCSDLIEQQQAENEIARRAEIQSTAEDKPWGISVVCKLYLKKMRNHTPLLSPGKMLDYFNTQEVPMISDMTEQEMMVMKDYHLTVYTYLLGLIADRKRTTYREVQLITKQTKVEKTREKATRQVEKQQKHASKDRTLTKEERGRAKIIEGMMGAMGISYEEAAKMVEVSLKGK